MMSSNDSSQLDQEWFDRGKEDAWAGKSKQPPEHDPQAASLYDLGYGEGGIERPPTSRQISNVTSVRRKRLTATVNLGELPKSPKIGGL